MPQDVRQDILDAVQPRERALFAKGNLYDRAFFSQHYTADRYFDQWVAEVAPQPVNPYSDFVFPKKYP